MWNLHTGTLFRQDRRVHVATVPLFSLAPSLPRCRSPWVLCLQPSAPSARSPAPWRWPLFTQTLLLFPVTLTVSKVCYLCAPVQVFLRRISRSHLLFLSLPQAHGERLGAALGGFSLEALPPLDCIYLCFPGWLRCWKGKERGRKAAFRVRPPS